MASKGSFNTGSSAGRYLTFNWWIDSQSIANNTTTIKWELYGGGSSGYVVVSEVKVTIDGSQAFYRSSSNHQNVYVNTTVASGTKTIKHNDDGSRSFSVSVSAGIYEWAINKSGSGSWSLTSIPRKATVDTAQDFTDEENPKITYTNSAGNSVGELKACIASTDGSTIYVPYRDISKTGTSYTFNLTDDERNTLRNVCKNAKNMDVKFYVRTIIGDSTYYSSLAKKLTITNASPTISPTVEDANSVTYRLTGDKSAFVKGYSDARFSFGDSYKKGASNKSYEFINGNKKSTSSSGTLNVVESGTFTFEVTDTRGYTASKTFSRQLIDYIPLTCILNAKSPNAEGEMNITVSGNYFHDSFGAYDNTLNLRYRYNENDGNYCDWIDIPPENIIKSSGKYSVPINITGLNYKSKYTFQAQAEDKLRTINSTYRTVKTTPVFDWSNDDFNFNVPVTNFMLQSPNGTNFLITVDDSGNLSATAVNENNVNSRQK